MHRLRSIIFLLSVPGIFPYAHAQTVQALVNASTIGTQESVTYTIEVSGADFNEVSVPSPPASTGLQIVSPSPSQSTNISWINGNVTRTISFSWRYRPQEEGQAQIAPATVEVAGTTFTTDAVSVAVVPQSQRPARARRSRSIFNPFPDPAANEPVTAITEEDIFIRATPSSTTPFVNEQVTIRYELFFRDGMQPQNSRLADSWDAEGFWREDLPVEGRPMPRSSIQNGLRYSSIVVKRVAVFPTRAGSLTVDPLRIATEVFSPGALGFGRSFFSGGAPYQAVERSSEPIRMEVRPRPPAEPEGYTDAVGQYRMQAQLSRTQVEIGEPVELEIQIAGKGNISTLEGPDVRVPGAFEAYDPEVTTTSNTSGGLAGGTKTFSYLLVPRTNGTFTIPALRFSYFDPATAAYESIERALPAIRVSGSEPVALPTSTLSSGFPVDDIAGTLPARHWRTYPAVPLHRSIWIYVAIALPLLFLAALALWQRRAVRLTTDVRWARGRRAHPLARRHLKQARQLYETGSTRAFYAELARAVLGFAGNRLNIAEVGMTRPQLDEAMAAAGIPGETCTRLQSFLSVCDAAQFAPDLPDRSRMDQAMLDASALIALIDHSVQK